MEKKEKQNNYVGSNVTKESSGNLVNSTIEPFDDKRYTFPHLVGNEKNDDLFSHDVRSMDTRKKVSANVKVIIKSAYQSGLIDFRTYSEISSKYRI